MSLVSGTPSTSVARRESIQKDRFYKTAGPYKCVMEFCSSPATRNTGGQDLSPIRIARGSRETLRQRRRQRNIWGAPDCQRIAVAQRTTAQRQNDSSNRLISNLRARRALIGLSCRWELHISSFSMWPRRILTPINAARRKDLNAKHREDVRSKIRRSWHSFAREHRERRSFGELQDKRTSKPQLELFLNS
jgi:hypothetical protein